MAARRASNEGGAPGARTPRQEAASREAHSEFVAEAEEILDRIREDLAELWEGRRDRSEVEPDLVNRLFRSAHSLKGLAGMFGLDAIGELAHHFEDILDGLRLGRVALDSPAIPLLEEGVSLLASLMDRVDPDGASSVAVDRAEVSDFVSRIGVAIEGGGERDADDLSLLSIDPSVLRALTEYEEHRLRENLRRGRNLVLVDATFDIATFEEGLAALTAAIRERGELVSTLPSSGAAPESQIRFSLMVATQLEAEALRAAVGLGDAGVEAVQQGTPSAPSQDVADRSSSEPSDSASLIASPDSRAAESAEAEERSVVVGSVEVDPSVEVAGGEDLGGDVPEPESLRSISDTVRVDIRKLDELMNLVGELVIQRNAVGHVAQRLMADVDTARVGAELAKTHKALERKLRELQTGVLDVRMVPLRQVFEKISRVARGLRRDLGKEVELEFEGAGTELDKLIVEQLIDPLVHLVRNAFDHAIEEPAEREQAGKVRAGRIAVRAVQRGNHVVIEVEDDGRGMDLGAILERARVLGRVAEGETPDRAELLDLVFAPGFSTCQEITGTSGRGVGMDVVRANLGEMGGSVEIETEAGRGTTVTATLPITLAIIQALIVGVGRERFAIPLSSVLETLVVEPEEIVHSESREILNLRGEPLLLRRLGEEFEIEGRGREERQFAVVLGMGEQRLGLLVDRLEGQQDTVIKSIKGPVRQIRGIAGATELGDRGAVLVIDVSAMLADAFRRREAA